ncbi:MAG: signal peptidase II [Clostridiales bacterium]|nr:signal peptidase II [Clostridiales bacterium]
MLKGKLKPSVGVKSIILIAVCAALVAIDLLTKYFAKHDVWDLVIIRGWIEIDGSIPNNQGCAFSFLNENPQIGQPILISLTSVMLVFLVGVFVFLPERFTIMKVTVAIVIAGAIGNLVDRLAFRSVRDFIGLNMQFNGNLVYCNFADFCITVGAVLAVLDLLFLGEWAIFPLTKSAKAAQAKKKEEELKKENPQTAADELPEPENGATDGNTDVSSGEDR